MHLIIIGLQFIQSVLENHGGSVGSAVHYLMAVLGDTEELPISDDIGGLPQIIQDESLSETESPTGSVVVEIEEQDIGGSGGVSECSSTDHPTDPDWESLPTYCDVTGGQSPPPPTYNSLHISESDASAVRPEHTTREVKTRPMKGLARIIRTKRREKKGYHSYGT